MTRTTAVRLGIPTGVLSRRILLPVGIAILAIVAFLSVWQLDRVQARVYQEQRSALRTVFELGQTVQPGSGGLVSMARNRNFERIWVVSATGDILNSNRPQEIGTQLEERWWASLKNLPSGLHQETTRFGNQELELLSLTSVEVGRQVVIVSRPARTTAIWLLNVTFILVAGLILWISVAAVVILNLRRGIERPTHKLDDRALELIRGGQLSDVQLDRVHAEIVESLGGHADCMVDLARKVQKQGRSLQQTSSRYSVLFNALPSPAFLLDEARRIVDANEALSHVMEIDAAWLRGRELSVLGEWIPVNRLNRWLDKTVSTPVGIRRMKFAGEHASGGDGAVPNTMLLTIAPIPSSAGRGHLVLVEEMAGGAIEYAIDGATDSAIETIDPDVPEPTSMEPGIPGSSNPETAAPESIGKSDSAHEFPSSESEKPGPLFSGPAFSSPIDTATLSGDGQAGELPQIASPAVSAANGLLAEQVMQTAGVVAIAFNDEAETIFFSSGWTALTGLSPDAVPDLKQFAKRVFPHDKERTLFRQWLDAEPDERSQELKIKTRHGIVSSVWRAGEWQDDDRGEVGVLWTTVDRNYFQRTADLPREPSVPSEDS